MDPAALRPGIPALGRLLARMLRAAAALLERRPVSENASDPLAATMEMLRRRYPDAPEHWLRFVAERHPAPDTAEPAARPPPATNTAQPVAVVPRFAVGTARASTRVPPGVRASHASARSGQPATHKAPPIARMPVPRPLFRSAQSSRPSVAPHVPPVSPSRPPTELNLDDRKRNSPAPRILRWAAETSSARAIPTRQQTVESPSRSVTSRNRFAQPTPSAASRTEPARAPASAPESSPAMAPPSRQVEVPGSRATTSAAGSDATLQFVPADNSKLPSRGTRFSADEPPWPELPYSAAPEASNVKAPAFDSPRTTEETYPWNGLPF